MSGNSRYTTAVEISKNSFNKSEYAVIASGDDFPDALSATSLATVLDAPVLLISKDSIQDEVLEELTRLEVKKIYIIGGESTISNKAIDKIDYEKEVLAGIDRYDTNNIVISEIEEIKGNSNGYTIVTGEKYADSVVAVGISIKEDSPIKLVNKVIEKQYNLDSNYIVGGKASVNISNLKGKRVSGSNRILTSLELAKISHPNSNSAIIASSENYADALSAVSLCKKYDAPILLTENNNLDKNILNYIKEKNISNFIIAGGSVSNIVIEGLLTGESVNFFKPVEIPNNIKEKMTGVSMPNNAKIGFNDLVYLPLLHYDFNGEIKKGEIIVNKKVGREVGNIFKELFDIKYPIEKIKLIDEYKADDNMSMADNNSSGFNYRLISGTNRLSKHAEGLAIDINPLYNPYIKNGLAIPKESQPYVNRGMKLEWMIFKNDKIYNIFQKYGWKWGGSWTNPDYQHFEK
nr:cell wall-binding repeat-containing protein [Miniphocaeibacter halophilus]